MPNNVINVIEFLGEKEKIKELVSELGTFYPETESLTYDDKVIYTDGTEYGWHNREKDSFKTRHQEDVIGVPEGWKQVMEEAWTRFPDFEKVFPMPKEIENTIGDSGLHPAWYTWSCDNWGTKWNSYSCVKKSDAKYVFETAWSSVPNIIEEIGKRFPEVEIKYEWSDEDTGYNCGYGNVCGEEASFVCLDGGSKDAYEMAFKHRPDYKNYYHLVDGKYEYREENEIDEEDAEDAEDAENIDYDSLFDD